MCAKICFKKQEVRKQQVLGLLLCLSENGRDFNLFMIIGVLKSRGAVALSF